MEIKKIKEDVAKRFLDREWKKETCLFGAFENKKLVGCITAEIKGGVCYVKDFLVAEGHRGKGIGKALWLKVEKLAKRKKCFRIAIKTHEKNKLAIKFYRKQGLKVDATLKDYQFHLKWYYMSKVI
ncbi:MAG: GNAT family N-acetyltransferase [Nanoarchaeota archaeon]|nr:GNAT family N-acetyltransferase [Nanoarchaeota archaeon]